MNLIQYNSSAVFAGPATAIGTNDQTNISQLFGIQSASFDFSEPLVDIISEQGFVERVKVNPNEITLSLGYFLRNGYNEKMMGFVVDGNSGLFSNFGNDERNYFVATKNDSFDIFNYSGFDSTIIAFAQGVITSYGVRGSIGQPVSANVSLSFLNVGISTSGSQVQLPIVNKQNGANIVGYGLDTFFYSGSGDSTIAVYSSTPSNYFTGSGTTPDYTADTFSQYTSGSGDTTDYTSLNSLFTIPFAKPDSSAIYAIGPGDMRLDLPEDSTFGLIISGTDACFIQSFDLTTALVRLPVRPINYVFPNSRITEPPIEVRFTVNAFVNKYKAAFLNSRFCSNSGTSLTLSIFDRCNQIADDFFTGSGPSGVDWSNDPFSFLFAGTGDPTSWDTDQFSYLYDGTNNIMQYRINGARLESTSVNFTVGNFQQVTYNWSAKIYSYQNITSPSITLFAPFA